MSLSEYVRKGKFYQAVVEDGSDIIFVVDYHGTILYHNRSVNETLGYRSKYLIQKNFFAFIKPEVLPDFKKQFTASCRKSFLAGVEFQFRCKDGSFKFLEFNSINLKNKNNIPGLILDCRDITQRKQDAAELVRAQQARQLFLANISHEIRTPINGIAGMATLLNQLPKTEEQATYLNAIRSSSENLKVIINDILDLAAIESGKLKFEKIGFSLNDLLKNLLDQYRLQAQQRGIELLLQKDYEGAPVLVGDPVRLNQILVNLLSNAIKFTSVGCIILKCELKAKGKSHWQALFSVKDTGIGIPQEKLQTIFESFSQADASITRKFGGTGLGLTIVRQLVEMQQGSIRVNSRENEGSEFEVSIAYKRGRAADIAEPDTGQTANHQHNLHGLFVLLVEDNDINQLYASSILKNMNCRFEVAENGYVAVEKLKTNVFDVVLMDVQMPVMDGYEATRAIRSNETLRQLPIIALTANASATERDKCKEVGMNDCVSKPFTPQELFAALSPFVKPEMRRPTVAPIAETPGQGINLQYLRKVSHNDQTFVRQMLATIHESLPRSVKEIETAVSGNDWATVVRTVHRMKPSFDMIGKTGLKAQAVELEEKLNAGQPRPAHRESLQRFLGEVQLLVSELAKLL
jgi:PAS domain S-box-containing protein